MGARPSPPQMPEAPRVTLAALPPELLVQVLSHVPPRALVTRCRPVCRAWRDVVGGPSMWLLQLARDGSADALAQRCPASDDRHDEFPPCALVGFCVRALLGPNLIFNSCRKQGFHWEVEHGGNGWAVEKNLTVVPGAPSQTCFVTSFECPKRPEEGVTAPGAGTLGFYVAVGDGIQVFTQGSHIDQADFVDLVMERVWQELLDSAQIEICVADWWGACENCGCIYRLRVCLLDEYESEVVKFSPSPNPILQWTESSCRVLAAHQLQGACAQQSPCWVSRFIDGVPHVFTGLGKGIRYMSLEQYGRDTRSWVGHCGALVTHSSVPVRICLS